MKIYKALLIGTALISLGLVACKQNEEEPEIPVVTQPKTDYWKDGKTSYVTDDFSITVKDENNDRIYVKSPKEIILISKNDVDAEENPGTPEYTLTGVFEGQIINKTKGSVLNFSNVELSNENAPAIYGEKKIEIKSTKNTENSITTTGTNDNKIGAVTCEKKIEIGGSGKITINSTFYHGVKADEVQIKGSGNLSISGTGTDGSAINCNVFEVKESTKVVEVVFQNFRHGIKADDTITINSGKFTFEESITVPMRTDTFEEDGKEGHKIVVSSRDYVIFAGGSEQEAKIKTDDLQLPPPADPA